MWFGVISLFPELFNALDYGILGRAKQRNLWDLDIYNPRDYSENKHRNVDDRPYGGGPGMVMSAEPLAKAIDAAKQVAGQDTKVVYLSPQGEVFNHQKAEQCLDLQKAILLCGRYEGVDERLIESHVYLEWSLGDFVLSGGEFAALAMIDSVCRLIPGALGDSESAKEDSFFAGLLDCPHYTRPEVYAGKAVPEVLTKGNHEEIRRWRLQQALARTWQRRPDLIADLELDAEQRELLAQIIDTR